LYVCLSVVRLFLVSVCSSLCVSLSVFVSLSVCFYLSLSMSDSLSVFPRRFLARV